MSNLQSIPFGKLKPANDEKFLPKLVPMLAEGEELIGSYQSMGGGMVFTNKRIIAIKVQGISGKACRFTSLPYSRIQTYAVKTAGLSSFANVLYIWFAGMGKIRLNFSGTTNVAYLCRIISENVL